MILHLVALHTHGSNNPTGIEKKKDTDFIPFHPYYTAKDLFYFAVFLVFFVGFIFFAPNFFGEADNYIPANPMVTPAHIVPEWYFLPFYAILRAIPNKLLGVIAMFGAIFVLFFLPWLDGSKAKSAMNRPLHRLLFWVFFVDVFILGWVGGNPPEGHMVTIGMLATAYYFAHFLVLLPFISRYEEPRLQFESISAHYEAKIKCKK